MHRRECLAKGKNGLGDAGVERRRRGKANLQFAQLAQLRTPGHVGGLVDLGQHPPRLFQEQSSGLAKRYPTVGAIEQTRPQFLLQCLDLLAQRWLGYAQHLRRPAKMQLFGHGNEVAQMAQFHTTSIKS